MKNSKYHIFEYRWTFMSKSAVLTDADTYLSLIIQFSTNARKKRNVLILVHQNILYRNKTSFRGIECRF